jgi:hypothetical protein
MTRSKTAESLVSALVILLIALLLILAHGDHPAGNHRFRESAPDAGTPRDVPAPPGPEAVDPGSDFHDLEGTS